MWQEVYLLKFSIFAISLELLDFRHMCVNTFLLEILRSIDWCFKKYRLSVKKIKFCSKSCLSVNLVKKWERQDIALSKPFNFYLKHFLIFRIISEIINKKYFRRNSRDRRKIFVRKFDFVLGEHDTTGGRPPKNF